MKSGAIVRVSLDEVKAEARSSKTDWSKLDATTQKDIERQISDDPDLREFEKVDWSQAAFVAAPAKQPISIRLDADVLDFFKAQGGGYQGRINRVLRHYMESLKKPAE